ncbi:hypothetical protein TOPB45_0904 [Thermodesulfobacterium geofontis OPF15]|jgi:hypothetical protein|uniref:Tetratricopeptide repeat protein n=1 Tax=Thermodesulfobacterium geofontis (strain OPF15) TaxID=795359 RepID=F8C5M3_THEGP|nr:hypothetical protein [Thermodesulfobacterium geofontis]AEH23002.1 hypothetical protein TOPB45_0904 [Thermodesulfobacterium geofontis OPF15]
MYYLKIIKHQKLMDFLFQAQAFSAETFLKDLLSRRLAIVDKNIYKLNPEDILYLDKILEKFKTEFSPLLKSAPIPFSFLLTKSQTEKISDTILRAGKIYLEDPSIKEGVNSFLKHSNIFYKIDSWKNLWELILPSTVDPKIELFYKDIFWYGSKGPCFFCKTFWHDSLNCPSLLDSEPRNTFLSSLNFHFREISQLLWKGIYEKDLDFNELKYFYIRNFYLLPEFLKVVFYRYDTIETWGHLKLDIETPIRGGNLGLGLEYLIKKNFESAKREFSEIEDDFRASIGLSLINIINKDLKSALYYIEKALFQVKTPFLKSYLLFLRGYFHEYMGESFIADEFYKSALEEDSTCLPALYYFNLAKYVKGSPLSEILVYFNHPYLLYWSYLEPLFIKDQRELEEFLYEKIAEKREQASQRLKETEDRYHKIKIFLSDSEKKEYEERLSQIRENIHKGGLGLIESGYSKALEIDLELQGYIYRIIKNLREDFEKIKSDYKNLSSFWRKYPYKYEDVNFGKELKIFSDLVQKIEVKLKRRDPSDVLSFLISEINSCKEKAETLKTLKEDLIKKWSFRIRLADFLRNFSLLEFIIAGVYIIVPYLPISENFKNFFSTSSFLLISLLLLIICLFFSYFKKYEFE